MRLFLRPLFLWLCVLWLCVALALANSQNLKPIDFHLFKLESKQESTNDYPNKPPTLLLIGGIQGDEPGGFNATNIFLNHYKITKGSVWVIPVINPHSMLLNHRGLYDDMNRKFATLSPKDPESPLINRAKSIISSKEVDLVLHLHDGSGFYRHTHQSELLSPKRWGNCTIIDQERLEGVRFGELDEIATHITKRVNAHILKPLHEYRVRNTKTAKTDKEMQKALTFYAINEGKPAFANEASKTLNLKERVYYHLLAIEALLEKVGIGFERDFTLSVDGVGKVIYDKNLAFSIEGMPSFPLFDLRGEIADFPLPANKNFDKIAIESGAKILGLLPRGNALTLKYGNNSMTKFTPKYVEFGKSNGAQIRANIDNKEQKIAFGEVIKAVDFVEITDFSEYDIKVVGLKSKPKNNKILIKKEYLNPLASIDKAGNLYRIEFYKKQTPQSSTYTLHTPRYASLESDISKPANLNKSAQVIASSAFVRSAPSEVSPPVAKAPKGRKLYVLGKTNALESSQIGGAWAKVEYHFGERKISGYVLESLLKYGDFVVDLDTTMVVANTNDTNAPISKNSINNASQNAKIQESNKESTKETSKESTKESNKESAKERTQKMDKKTAQVIASSAFVRSEPSEVSPFVAKAPKGRKLYVLGKTNALESSQIGGAWAKVEYIFGGRKISGYVLESLLKYGDFVVDSSLDSAFSPKDIGTMPKKQILPKEIFMGMILVDFSR
ncbi:M99 family carboxypeptidase catalytic domain-containing protein [Helicobacter sp. T3_23-1056]